MNPLVYLAVIFGLAWLFCYLGFQDGKKAFIAASVLLSAMLVIRMAQGLLGLG